MTSLDIQDSGLRNTLLRAAQEFGTPVYVYDQQTIVQRCRALLDCITYPRKQLLYAMKANSNQAVVRTILAAGFGLDCVSLGEIAFARKLGARKVLFTFNNIADGEF